MLAGAAAARQAKLSPDSIVPLDAGVSAGSPNPGPAPADVCLVPLIDAGGLISGAHLPSRDGAEQAMCHAFGFSLKTVNKDSNTKNIWTA